MERTRAYAPRQRCIGANKTTRCNRWEQFEKPGPNPPIETAEGTTLAKLCQEFVSSDHIHFMLRPRPQRTLSSLSDAFPAGCGSGTSCGSAASGHPCPSIACGAGGHHGHGLAVRAARSGPATDGPWASPLFLALNHGLRLLSFDRAVHHC